MSDRRLERLRQIDAAVVRPPWPSRYLIVDFGHDSANAEMIAAARNIFPATIELIEGLLERHDECVWPCEDYMAALAVLDQIGADGD